MSADPKQAIIDAITAPPGRREIVGQSPGGWQAVHVTGGPAHSAAPDSIRFLKERAGVSHRLFAVAYVDQDGRENLDVRGTALQKDGTWLPCGGAGGGRDGPNPEQPWVNFCGWWSPELYCAGGPVVGKGADRAHHVELRFADGARAQDTVDDGLVLFVLERAIEPPVTAGIYDADGNLLAEHPGIPQWSA